MEVGFLGVTTAFFAGMLSTLSPCVLPILPILFGSASAQSRGGVIALATGLAMSFAIIGTLLSTVGFAIGFDAQWTRYVGSILLMSFGVFLLIPMLQARLSARLSIISDIGNGWMARVNPEGIKGQWLLGLLLGIVWTPCVGPTLGAAVTMASQGENLSFVTTVMVVFGLGAALPMIVLGLISRETLVRLRGRLMTSGQRGKYVLGAALIAVALLIISGQDKALEAWVTAHAPDAWITLTTRY